MARKQKTIPGTDADEIEELTDASELYQKTIRERLEVQKREVDQKKHVLATVVRLIKEGSLTLNPSIPDGEKQAVYKYHDDENNLRTVYCCRDEMTVTIKVEKPKDD